MFDALSERLDRISTSLREPGADLASADLDEALARDPRGAARRRRRARRRRGLPRRDPGALRDRGAVEEPDPGPAGREGGQRRARRRARRRDRSSSPTPRGPRRSCSSRASRARARRPPRPSSRPGSSPRDASRCSSARTCSGPRRSSSCGARRPGRRARLHARRPTPSTWRSAGVEEASARRPRRVHHRHRGPAGDRRGAHGRGATHLGADLAALHVPRHRRDDRPGRRADRDGASTTPSASTG